MMRRGQNWAFQHQEGERSLEGTTNGLLGHFLHLPNSATESRVKLRVANSPWRSLSFPARIRYQEQLIEQTRVFSAEEAVCAF